MKAKNTYLVVISLVLCTLSCQFKENKKENNLSKVSISTNQIGCLNINNTSTFTNNQLDSLIGKSEMEIVQTLAQPYKKELYDRGQKFFFYKVNCDTAGVASKSLRIRFSALSYVNEVLILEADF